jgi:hypothetical protein
VTRKDHIAYSLVFTIVCILQYLCYLKYIGIVSGLDFWTPLRGGILIVLLVLYTLYLFLYEIYFVHNRFLGLFDKYMLPLGIGTLFVLNILLLMFNYDHVIINIANLFLHMFINGYHGCIWIVLLLTYPLIIDKIGKEKRDVLLSLYGFLIAYVLLVLTLMAFRQVPIQSYLGDSSNRMLLHVEFIISIILCIAIKEKITKIVANE